MDAELMIMEAMYASNCKSVFAFAKCRERHGIQTGLCLLLARTKHPTPALTVCSSHI